MSATTSCTAGDLRVGDLIVAVNGHPAPGGEPAEVAAVEWGLVNNVLELTLRHGGREVPQHLHVDEPVEVER